MPEVTQAEMFPVLAEKGMGWRVHAWKPDITFETVLVAVKPNGNNVYLNSDYAPNWDPFTDGRAAFELLKALKTRHSSTVPSPNLDTWGRFCQRLIARLPERTGPAVLNEHGGLNSYSNFPMPRDVIAALAVIGPALIAQAAYEALAEEASHDSR